MSNDENNFEHGVMIVAVVVIVFGLLVSFGILGSLAFK